MGKGPIKDIPAMRVAELRRALAAEWRPLANLTRWLALCTIAIAGFFAFSGTTGQPDADMQLEIVTPPPPPAAPAPKISLPPPVTPPPPAEEQPLPEEKAPGPAPDGHVRIAAAQMQSVLGAVAENRQRMAEIIRKAAAVEVKIIVFPEACVQGYADISEGIYWTKGSGSEMPLAEKAYDERPPEATDPAEYRPLAEVTETADGESIRFLAALAKECGMYIAAPIIERANGRFYSASFLLDPSGKTLLHWRKTALWTPGDTAWATPGDLPPAVAETPYGRIGLMIGLEYPTILPKLAEKGAHIVLYACAFYGHNFESFFRSRRFLDPIKQGKLCLALANWTVRDSTPWWEGYGMSRIVMSDGLTKRIRYDRGDGLVIADIPLPTAKATKVNEEKH